MTETVGATRQELTDTERAVLDAVRDLARRGELVRDLGALLRIPSVTGSDAEADAQHGWRTASGGSVSTSTTGGWTSTTSPPAPDFPGTEAPRTEAWGRGRHDAGTPSPAPRRSCCRGTSTSSRPATRRAGTATRSSRGSSPRDGRDVLVGRGACDMKGGVVAALAALAASAAGRRPDAAAGRAARRRRRGGRRAGRVRHARPRPRRATPASSPSRPTGTSSRRTPAR